MGIALKGDFIGFWIDDIHSSELGIIRTSDGSRFNENLLPTIQDKTVQVPGGDGFYYFGSYYTQRQFNIPIAFDNMSEAQFRKLRQVIGDKKMVKLVFDEAPYKYYSVKSTGSPTLKYICFDVEDDTSNGSVDDVYAQTSTAATKRVYKGEGTLNFIAYDPFGYARAIALKKSAEKDAEALLKLPDGTSILNTEEWLFTDLGYSYPLPEAPQVGAWVSADSQSGQMQAFYNTGDLPCDYQFFCEAEPGNSILIANYQFNEEDDITNLDTEIVLKLDIPIDESQTKFCFDSRTNCVFGWNDEANQEKQKIVDYDKIYNKYLSAARFGKLPVGGQSLWVFNVANAPDIQAKFKYF